MRYMHIFCISFTHHFSQSTIKSVRSTVKTVGSTCFFIFIFWVIIYAKNLNIRRIEPNVSLIEHIPKNIPFGHNPINEGYQSIWLLTFSTSKNDKKRFSSNLRQPGTQTPPKTKVNTLSSIRTSLYLKQTPARTLATTDKSKSPGNNLPVTAKEFQSHPAHFSWRRQKASGKVLRRTLECTKQNPEYNTHLIGVS
jgi:hypothetical protein